MHWPDVTGLRAGLQSGLHWLRALFSLALCLLALPQALHAQEAAAALAAAPPPPILARDLPRPAMSVSQPTLRPGEIIELRRALTAAGDGRSFPTDQPTLMLELPDEWAQSRPGFAGSLWYRSTFKLARAGTAADAEANVGAAQTAQAVESELVTLYIERACSSIEVYLNGQLLHTSGAHPRYGLGDLFLKPMAPLAEGPFTTFIAPAGASSIHDCHHPQLVALPDALLLPAGNVLDIKVSGQALTQSGSRLRAGGMSVLRLGPQNELKRLHSRQTALQVTVPQALSATLVLTGGFMFVLGFFNRRESHLAYFGALCVGWAGISSRMWLRSVPMSHASAEFLVVALLGFIAWATIQFLLRYGGKRERWVDIGLPLQCALLTLSLALAGANRLNLMSSIWYVVLSLEVLAAALWYLNSQRGHKSFWVMGSLLAAATVAALIETAVQWGRSPSLALQVAELVGPVVLVLVGLRLVQQHGRALQHAEEGKAHLEQRVREATAEIERNFRVMAELRVEQVTERERKRIAGDLHDDLGAKLLTIVHTSESDRISTLAREALEEMRLSVRGLTGKAVRLADALGDWRAEVVSRLAQASIQADWSAPEDLPQTLSARAYVQTTRILREATSNIIKHSGASKCSITAGISDGDFQLVVQDDGSGISAEVERRLDRGHGLASMKNRAKQMQGQCLVESGPGYGTVIRLTIPLTSSTEGAP